MTRLSVPRTSLLLVLVAVLGGCIKIGSAPGSSGSPVPSVVPGVTARPSAAAAATPTPAPTPTATPRPTSSQPTPSPAPTETPDDGTRVIEVALNDSLTIDPDTIRVTAGEPVRFVVTNAGALEHDFFVGSDKEQKQRESGSGTPGKDRFIAVPPGETVALTMTFDEPGKTIAGCTIAGHYSGGMRSEITIKAP